MVRPIAQESLSTQDISLVTADRYYPQIAEDISRTRSGDRVLVAAMGFDPAERPVQKIVSQLVQAATRGAQVNLFVDAFTFLIGGHSSRFGPLFWNKELPRGMSREFAVRSEELAKVSRKESGEVTLTNKPSRPFTNPFSNRSHLKTAIINDRVALGGCNLAGTYKQDIMIRFKHSGAADFICSIFESIKKHRGYVREALGDNKEFQVDEQSRILVDAGIKGESLIYDRALQLMDEAEKELTLTCQYVPDRTTAKHLIAAHKRGVKLRVLYNHPSHHGGFERVWQQAMLTAARVRRSTRVIGEPLPKKHRTVHAKILASEDTVMIGSHNYVESGVKAGLAEMTFERSNDQEFAHTVVDFVSRYIKDD